MTRWVYGGIKGASAILFLLGESKNAINLDFTKYPVKLKFGTPWRVLASAGVSLSDLTAVWIMPADFLGGAWSWVERNEAVLYGIDHVMI